MALTTPKIEANIWQASQEVVKMINGGVTKGFYGKVQFEITLVDGTVQHHSIIPIPTFKTMAGMK